MILGFAYQEKKNPPRAILFSSLVLDIGGEAHSEGILTTCELDGRISQ